MSYTLVVVKTLIISLFKYSWKIFNFSFLLYMDRCWCSWKKTTVCVERRNSVGCDLGGVASGGTEQCTWRLPVCHVFQGLRQHLLVTLHVCLRDWPLKRLLKLVYYSHHTKSLWHLAILTDVISHIAILKKCSLTCYLFSVSFLSPQCLPSFYRLYLTMSSTISS